MFQSSRARCPTPSLGEPGSVIPIAVAVVQLGTFYVLLKAFLQFKILRVFENLALHVLLEHPEGNLFETWLWHAGGATWISGTWRSSRCSPSPATGPSLRSALLIESAETAYPSGALPNFSPPHSCDSPFPAWGANRLKLRDKLDTQSESANSPSPPEALRKQIFVQRGQQKWL